MAKVELKKNQGKRIRKIHTVNEILQEVLQRVATWVVSGTAGVVMTYMELREDIIETTVRVEDQKAETTTVVKATRESRKYQIRDISGSRGVVQGDYIVNNYNLSLHIDVNDFEQLAEIDSKLPELKNQLEIISSSLPVENEADAKKAAELDRRLKQIGAEFDELASQAEPILSRSTDYPRLREALGTA